jgi:hypothetical protein
MQTLTNLPPIFSLSSVSLPPITSRLLVPRSSPSPLPHTRCPAFRGLFRDRKKEKRQEDGEKIDKEGEETRTRFKYRREKKNNF